MKIAISGKGGVGKTTIMALLAAQLQKEGRDVLVIDADPSPHMAQTIGVENVERITPIADMKEMLIERSGKTPGSPFYQINPQVDDLMERFMLKHDGIRLMVLGAIQTGDGGCACPENNVLRRLLTKLLLGPSQVVLLDMEAGVEHLGRGTIAGADHLLIVVIPTQSSIRTAARIKKLAKDVGIPRISYVGNLIRDKDDEIFLTNALETPPIAFFPDSAAIRKAERDRLPITSTLPQVEESARTLLAALMNKG
ncbi:MAG: carbon monoxide dehydrogenase [Deltaproteobacteria bacterium RIFOXYD12_FULL_57_12]|nr:MAG: carbon monoxide dehydrogenase [Deltaproteobacteria bacterium RIFOXYD12_FULL_57_12]